MNNVDNSPESVLRRDNVEIQDVSAAEKALGCYCGAIGQGYSGMRVLEAVLVYQMMKVC
jgi:hypothetical protein